MELLFLLFLQDARGAWFRKHVYRTSKLCVRISWTELVCPRMFGQPLAACVCHARALFVCRCAHPFAKQNRRYVQSCSALFPGGARRGFSKGMFWIWLKIGRFRDLGGPGGLPNHPERWGAKPPTFLDGFQSPPGPPRPRNGRCSAKFKSPLLVNDEDLGARSCGRVELQSFF